MQMEWYLKIHDYTENVKFRISIFNISGIALIWWKHLVQVKGIVERRVDWSRFRVKFQEKYLMNQYYDHKRKEFHNQNLGKKSMEEYVQKFMELLHYVD